MSPAGLSAAPFVTGAKERQSVTTELASVSRPTTLGFVNAHAFNLCCDDGFAAQFFLDCDLLLRDGIGMGMLCDCFGIDAGLNMNGTDYIPAVLDACRGRTVALLGTGQPHLDRAVRALRNRGTVIVHAVDGFDPMTTMYRCCAASPPISWSSAWECPGRSAALFTSSAPWTTRAIICGGAIIDFLGGRTKRAPRLVRSAGCEWLFRLAQEPRRLFRRYVFGNVRFLARMAWLKWRSVEIAPHAYAPRSRIR